MPALQFPWFPPLNEIDLRSILVASFIIATGYCLSTAIYRLYFSPLAKIPGDKLAALTSWYNGYYDVVVGGQYIFVVEEMHRKYGPVVRTRPDAVHVNDPHFIDKLYTQSPKQRRDRAWTILATMQLPGSMLATGAHDLHRKRRAVLNPFFSQQNVRRLEPVINDTLAHLLHRMKGWATSGEPVQLNSAYQAATKDIIHAYAFGEGARYLDMQDCNRAFFEVMAAGRTAHLGTHMNWFMKLLTNTPPSILKHVSKGIATFAGYVEELETQIEGLKKAQDLPEGKTIFHEILKSNMPESEKATPRLRDEATVLVIAGADTTATTLSVITYYLLSNKALLKRLKAELETVMPDPNQLPKAADLDQLQFLNAVIQEAIRLHPSASHRQDRIAPDEDLVYESMDGQYKYTLPAGTTIGMAAPLLNKSPLVYTRPNEFDPERYLEDPSLRKYLMSFSKGTRQCIGINLAYQELQTFVAGIFRRYDVYDASKPQQGPTMELFETTMDDIAMFADYVTPSPKPGTQKLRVRLRA
ncbi:hypothetical protein S7711_07712 [Stachybotrys chartarum IBT 7711]|uniref:Uncharacterized protein n=1 Tax=Stachybotrys chartarum (strain CBS 109288 / IBT 7711) TaxID=1280523 RepID=A0A084B7Y6_STACB|nr:hypothetical protein S7711_07712 [Stachybotrys chartarum IBT 7711]KFA56514.1 hypothetical protein S40293_01120 [Stachybotrys chartarum IBT 40293]